MGNQDLSSGPRKAAERGLISTPLRNLSRVLAATSRATGALSSIARFAAGAMAFKGRPDDIFIVSYPRSGTTWVQVILHHLFSDQEFGFDHISEVSPFLERALFRGIDLEHLPSRRIFKTHLPAKRIFRRLLRQPGKFIYVHRNPADVSLSYYHFYADYHGYADSFENFLKRFKSGKVQYGRWDNHVLSWRNLAKYKRVLFVSYEDMKHDPTGTINRIAQFCGSSADEAKIRRVSALSSFDQMKAHQLKFDVGLEFLWESGIKYSRFIREGRSAQFAGTDNSSELDAITAMLDRAWS